MRSIFVLCVLLLACPAWAGHAHPEKFYQEIWCERQAGVLEKIMPSGSRCDCLTDTHAVEFDFAYKWAESIGQSLNYAAQTGRRAGIVLILEKPDDKRYVKQVLIVRDFNKLALDLWLVDQEGRDLGQVK